MKIDGRDIVVFIQEDGLWRAMAYGTTCELDVKAEMKAVSSPDTEMWQKVKKGRYSWSGSSGHLVAARRQRTDVFELLAKGKKIKVAFATVAGSSSPRDYRQYIPDGRYGLKGDAIITRLTVTGRKGDSATFSMSFQGAGALSEIGS